MLAFSSFVFGFTRLVVNCFFTIFLFYLLTREAKTYQKSQIVFEYMVKF